MKHQIFEGIKIAEFAAIAAGPLIGKHMADHGATAVHVESHERPDGFRQNYPPYKDNKPGINRSGAFTICNNNKYGVTINLKAKGGVDLAKKLIAWADIVIENFTPGTMKKLGLGYEDMQKVNPDIILLSSCNQGQTGPHAFHRDLAVGGVRARLLCSSLLRNADLKNRQGRRHRRRCQHGIWNPDSN